MEATREQVREQVAAWESERAAILNDYRSGRIANVVNGRLAQLNSNLSAAYAHPSLSR